MVNLSSNSLRPKFSAFTTFRPTTLGAPWTVAASISMRVGAVLVLVLVLVLALAVAVAAGGGPGLLGGTAPRGPPGMAGAEAGVAARAGAGQGNTPSAWQSCSLRATPVPITTESAGGAQQRHRRGVAGRAVVVPLAQDGLLRRNHTHRGHVGGQRRREVPGDAAKLQLGRHHREQRRQHRVAADLLDQARVVGDAVGRRVAAAVEEVVAPLQLQVAVQLHVAGLHRVQGVAGIAAEEQGGAQADHHGQQRGQRAAAVAQQVAQGQIEGVHWSPSSAEYSGRSPEGMAGRLGGGPALGPPMPPPPSPDELAVVSAERSNAVMRPSRR
jgi:hypothetical protein